MTASPSSIQGKDGTGALFWLANVIEAISGYKASSVYLKSPASEGLVEPPTAANVAAIVTALDALLRVPLNAGTSDTEASPVQGVTNGVPFATLRNPVAAVETSASAASLILKASAGQLVDCSVLSTVAGYLMIFNSATVPADGTVTPVYCLPVASNQLVGIDVSNIPETFSAGICAVISTTGPYTKTIAVSGTAFIRGRVI